MNNEQNNLLSKLEKVPTQVPNDQYFESLKANVFSKLKNEPKIIPFYRKTWIQAAASIFLLIGIGTIYLSNSKETMAKPNVDFSSLNKQDILKYIEENQEDFESEDLAALLTEAPSIEQTKYSIVKSAVTKSQEIKTSKSAELEKMWKEINDEEILDYLEQENFDFDDDLIYGS